MRFILRVTLIIYIFKFSLEGTEQECNETAERLLDRRESNKILQDINKNGINFCKMQIETDFDKMNDKLREKNDRIIELEKSLNELSCT